MSHMPYWLAKTPEMLAMDRWFSFAGGVTADTLAERYQRAIDRVTAPNDDALRGGAASLGTIRDGQSAADDAFTHFGKDWINPDNLNSGGDFWPQIPSWQIIIWLRYGVYIAAKKALGSDRVTDDPNHLFKAEIETDPSDARNTVLPLTTIWVCTGNTSSAGFEVDAVRGPTAVELVIATPPPRIPGRLSDDVKLQIDQYWAILHHDVRRLPDPPGTFIPEGGDSPES